MEQQSPASETTLGYEIFRPLWAIITLGAVASTRSKPMREVSLAEYVTSRRSGVDRLLGIIRDVGDFSAETMAIFEEQGGWHGDRAATIDELAMYMVMYSGFIEEYPPNVDNPAVIRRMFDAGVDLQLATLINSLVGAAMVRGSGVESSSDLIVDAVRTAGLLIGIDEAGVASDAFRLWRVAFLPAVLRPDSVALESVRGNLREYVRTLENRVELNS